MIYILIKHIIGIGLICLGCRLIYLGVVLVLSGLAEIESQEADEEE